MREKFTSNFTTPPVLQGSTTFLLSLYFVFKIIPALVATLAIYLGYRLFILGVSGQASLSVNSQSISGQLLNAAPGLFFAVGGLVTLMIVVWKSVSIAPVGSSLSHADLQGVDSPFILTAALPKLKCLSCGNSNRRWRVLSEDDNLLQCETCGSESELFLRKGRATE